jgi:hypothetical protein
VVRWLRIDAPLAGPLPDLGKKPLSQAYSHEPAAAAPLPHVSRTFAMVPALVRGLVCEYATWIKER